MDRIKIVNAIISSLLLLFIVYTEIGVAQQGDISIGQIVEVVTSGQNLNLRSGPGTKNKIVANLANGTRMLVVGGPETADDFTWWELENSQVKGWAAGKYLRTIEGSDIQVNTLPNAQFDNNCESTYAGIQYCMNDDGITHIIYIELDNPHVRFETVIAEDAKSVNTLARDYVNDMANRNLTRGVVAAINADYFGNVYDPEGLTIINGHGPEGLTIINGQRFDGLKKGDYDNNSVYRSALVISKSPVEGGLSPISADVVRLETDDQQLDTNRYYNAIGGGPQIIFDGKWKWNRREDHPDGCPDEIDYNDRINGECFRNTGDWNLIDKIWTVAAITEDNQLMLLVTPYPYVERNLIGVKNAIKLDGGGSSQMWYSGKTIIEGKRKVADSLLVFYIQSLEVQEQPSWPIVMEGDRLPIRITIKNTGADTWTSKDYKLISLAQSLRNEKELSLPHDVKPGETVTWEWMTDPFDGWGVNISKWVMYKIDQDGNKEFPGEAVEFRVIVLPQELQDKKVELENRIQELISEGVDHLEQRIIEEIGKILKEQILCPISILWLPMSMMLFHRSLIKRNKN